jgi:hypothetical protein
VILDHKWITTSGGLNCITHYRKSRAAFLLMGTVIQYLVGLVDLHSIYYYIFVIGILFIAVLLCYGNKNFVVGAKNLPIDRTELPRLPMLAANPPNDFTELVNFENIDDPVEIKDCGGTAEIVFSIISASLGENSVVIVFLKNGAALVCGIISKL